MLRKIVLVLTKEYKEKIYRTSSYEAFVRVMQQHRMETELFVTEEFLKKDLNGMDVFVDCDAADKKNILYLSDDHFVLKKLQNEGSFTVALYHKGVNGILSGTQYALEGLEETDWDYLIKVHQRYCGIPWHISETKRCLIREMGPEDLEDLYELYREPEVTRYTEALFQDKEQEKQYINDYIENIYKYYGFGTWLIHRKEDGKLIGRAGFNYRPGYEEVELGFVIGCPYWRMGYAYEVCIHLLQLGDEVFGFEKVQALVDKRNLASVSLLEKLGFVYEEDVFVENQKFQRYLYKQESGKLAF